MKMLLITAGIVGLFNSTNANAKNSEASFQEEFTHEISYPKDQLSSSKEVVFISFHVNEDGTFEVEEMNASNEKLAKYVEEKIEAMLLDRNDIRAGQTYYYKMSFTKQ